MALPPPHSLTFHPSDHTVPVLPGRTMVWLTKKSRGWDGGHGGRGNMGSGVIGGIEVIMAG